MAGPWLLVKASQPSLPGETLYSVKKISEQFQTKVASEKTKTQLQMEFASRRLDELNRITSDSLTSEENSEKVKEVVNSLKGNLASASVYVSRMDMEKAIIVAKKTQKIKEDLDKTKEEASAELKNDLAEAEKSIKEINNQVLTVLNKEGRRINEEQATTTPDEEILIFLEELESGIITTTQEIINQVEE